MSESVAELTLEAIKEIKRALMNQQEQINVLKETIDGLLGIIAKKEGLECSVCHKIKPDVSIRACAYQAEINNDHEYTEQICDDCEYEHRMDI